MVRMETERRETERRVVVTELLASEKRYVTDLKLLIKLYYEPLQTKLSQEDMTLLFSNIETILNFHREWLTDFEQKSQDEVQVGAIFMKYIDTEQRGFKNMYKEYCLNSTAIETLERLQETKFFTSILLEGLRNRLSCGQPLGSLLNRPSQRILAYPALLEKLMKVTPETDPDYANLEAASSLIKDVVYYIERKRTEDEDLKKNVEELKRVESVVNNCEELKISADPHRELLKEDEFIALEVDNTQFLLKYYYFSDMLVCARPYKKKKLVTLQEMYTYVSVFYFNSCLVRDLNDEFQHTFEILNIGKNDKIHKFRAKTQSAKNLLVASLTESIYNATSSNWLDRYKKYQWFLETTSGDEIMTDLSICYSAFCTALQFLQIFEAKYQSCIDQYATEILRQFLGTLTAADFIVVPEPEPLSRTQSEDTVIATDSGVAADAAAGGVAADGSGRDGGGDTSSNVTADGSVVTADASVVTADASVVTPEHTFVTPEHTFVTVDDIPSMQHVMSSVEKQTQNVEQLKDKIYGILARIANTKQRTLLADIVECLLQQTTTGERSKEEEANYTLSPPITPRACTKEEGIAYEMTLSEWSLFNSVRMSELVNAKWLEVNAADNSPHVLQILEKFNWTMRWVSSCVVKKETAEDRARELSSFITLAVKLRELNNFNGVMEVISALQSPPIARLKQSWALVPLPKMIEFTNLSDLMKRDKNFGHYRTALTNGLEDQYCSVCLPFIEIFLADLVHIDESYPKRDEGREGTEVSPRTGSINLHYLQLMGSKLREFKKSQRIRRPLQKGNSETSIYNDVIFREDELVNLSLLREDKSSGDVQPKRRGSYSINISFLRHSGGSYPPSARGDNHMEQDHLTERDWQVLLSHAEKYDFPKGTVLTREQFYKFSYKVHFYRISSGRVGMYKNSLKVMDMYPGDVFLSAMNENWVTDLVCDEDTVIVASHRSLVNPLLDDDFELAARFYKHFALQLNFSLRGLLYGTSTVNTKGGLDRSSGEENIETIQKAQDKTFASFFNFAEDVQEVVVKVFNCKFHIYNGQLFVTQNLICFYAKLFARTKKKVIPLCIITKLKLDNLVLTVKTIKTDKRFTFKTEKEAADCATIASSLRGRRSSSDINIFPVLNVRKNNEEELQTVLSEADWSLIMKGMKTITYPAGTVIIAEGGKNVTKIMQIVRGVISLRKKFENKTCVLARRSYGEIIGEMNFLDPDLTAAASVVADTEVEVYELEFSYFYILLGVYKHLPPKVYKYLALLSYKRFVEYVSIL